MKKKLTKEEIESHIASLWIALDPNSPFFGMIRFTEEDGLLALPIAHQHQIFREMPPALKEHLDNYASNLQKKD